MCIRDRSYSYCSIREIEDVDGSELPFPFFQVEVDGTYTELTGLTLEAREKLARIRPKNLGQAGRIPGVSPSDVAQLSIALAANKSKA